MLQPVRVLCSGGLIFFLRIMSQALQSGILYLLTISLAVTNNEITPASCVGILYNEKIWRYRV